MTTNDTLTDEIDTDMRLGKLVLQTDWPDEIEILEVKDNEGTIIAQAETVYERHEACKSLAKQGWHANASRSAITQMTLTVSNQVDAPVTEGQ